MTSPTSSWDTGTCSSKTTDPFEIEPVIDSVWNMEEANEAHARMEANLNIGKMIILMD